MMDRSNPNLSDLLFAEGKIKPIYEQSRIVYASFQIIQLVNPWIALHNGSIVDAAGLAAWELTIPQYECGCRRFYAEYKMANPPDFTTPEAFFAWGVALHNAVNRKLGKPELTIDEALSIWRKSDAYTEDGSEIVP